MEFQHVKPGKGVAFVRSKLRKLENGNIQEKTFRAGEKVNTAHLERNTMQYLYASGNNHAFMDTQTYEQIEIPASQIEHELKFLKENMEVNVIINKENVLDVELPNNGELQDREIETGRK